MNKPTKKSGPEAERLKLDGEWQEKVKEALAKPKPGSEASRKAKKPKPKAD